jgi:DUF4097 and DUF4098 domain-containing protein YvlB
MFYIVSISWWAASRSDDRVSVYLESASSPEDAQRQSKQRLSFIADAEFSVDDHIFDIQSKSVQEANIGLVYGVE